MRYTCWISIRARTDTTFSFLGCHKKKKKKKLTLGLPARPRTVWKRSAVWRIRMTYSCGLSWTILERPQRPINDKPEPSGILCTWLYSISRWPFFIWYTLWKKIFDTYRTFSNSDRLFSFYRPNYVSKLQKFDMVRSLYINASLHHLNRTTPIIHLTRYFAW